MKKLLTAIVACAALMMTPMVASAQPQPLNITVWPGNPQRSSQFCDMYARDWANWVTERGQDAAVGALIGGGIGAVLGGIFRNRPGAGALIGAGVGAGVGAFADRPEWRAQYDAAYSQCLQGQQLAYPWLYNFNGGRYVAGSPEWYAWCTQAYGSYFDPASGTYLAADGRRYPCIVP